MAKLVIPEGFVLVEAKPRGKQKRSFGDIIIEEMREVGDGFWLTKGNGEPFNGPRCPAATVKQAKLAIAAAGIEATFVEVANVLEGTVQGFFTATSLPKVKTAKE
jgi:hypothetical protein